MHRTIECKLYPTHEQAKTLESWLRICCSIYNRSLEHRIKSYERRRQSITYNLQSALLTKWRERIAAIRAVPLQAARSALRRLDHGFKAFFRRCKSGETPGYPRFRPHQRYNSLEFLAPARYVRNGCRVFVPKLGLVKCRGGNQRIPETQRLLRIIRRASGWYIQVLIEDGHSPPAKKPITSAIGIDVGLTSFVAMSNGDVVGNPRFGRKSERQLRRAQQAVSRCHGTSHGRRKSMNRVRRIHERIAAQRKDFAHQLSRRLVNQYTLIAVENLGRRGLAKSKFAKSIMDAAWSQFINQLNVKAEYAGHHLIAVNPYGTSQTCPNCGAVRKKDLWERVHNCPCGCHCDRDVAAAKVILARALGVAGAVEGSTTANRRKACGKSAR